MSVFVNAVAVAGGAEAGSKLNGLGRCPHCSIAKPNMNRLYSDKITKRGMGHSVWASYRCDSCKAVVTGKFEWNNGNSFDLVEMFPMAKTAHEDIPEPARTFLQQAFETLHAPDAAAVMAGSAIDGMLKHHQYTDGSLYSRIDKALADNLLTKGMADWAHEVRLGSNRPRHADADRPHVSPDEAKQSVEFAEAMGNFLFVLTAKIDRGIAAAKAAET